MKIFVDANEKTVREYLSIARRTNPLVVGEVIKPKVFTKITEEEIEKLIIKRLNANCDNANIRLAIEYLKLKRAESGLEDDLDINLYIKKVVSAQ